MLYPKAILPVETNPTTKFRELPFKRVKMAKTQRRFQNRYCLEPDVNLKDYRCHAVIDFVEFEFTSADPTQFRYVQDVVRDAPESRTPHVETLAGSISSGTKFSVRVQDPTVADLLAISAAIETRFGCKVPPQIRVIEVSVDFYPRKPDDAAREIMVGVLQRTYRAKHDVYDDPMSRPRFVGAAGKKRFLQRWFKHTSGRTRHNRARRVARSNAQQCAACGCHDVFRTEERRRSDQDHEQGLRSAKARQEEGDRFV